MKTKRLLALVLVLAMTVAVFAMPAAAASTSCPICQRNGTAVSQEFVGPYSYITVGSCINYSATHTHTQNAHLVPFRCVQGHYYNVFIAFANVTCPYGPL